METTRFLLLIAAFGVLSVHSKCPPGSDPCSGNMEFLRAEIEKATQEYKTTLEQKVNEIAQILRHMAGDNLIENAGRDISVDALKGECSLKEIHTKLSTFENELTSALKELPTRISRVDGKFELTMKKFEQDKVSTLNFLDVKLGEIKTTILTELYAKLSDMALKSEKLDIGRSQQIQSLETRIATKLEPMVVEVERKMNKFMEKVDKTEEKKQLARDIQKRSVEEMFYSLNTTILSEMNAHFARADEKLTELDQHREKTIEDLDEKITALVSPLARDVRESSLLISKQIEQLNNESQVRGQEMTNFLSRAAESLKKVFLLLNKIEIKLLSDCSKAGRLTLTALSTGQYYFSTVETDWYKAKAFCDRFGMQLASIETEEERKTLFEAAPIKNNYYWLSGSDIGHIPGHFYWSTGHRVDDTWWSSGQPNDFGEGKETCLELHTNGGRLIDYKCSDDDYFICELGPDCKYFNNLLQQ
ncbi:C-type lectin domain family 4 member M-like isoform X2 [Neocloeon triangulifer]|uniref:C-type lectin domain family 4 member M-like isoform X2 n=1 Tax=Neocloeon triangulifer TaxID=2078957 RepID=UPI00286EED9F|nr:C-type lectin domain family 4 member M-like isoform X2 [Neocloeon triangulifer]